jgi:hypothetical protein
VLAGRGDHGGDEPASARPSDAVEVVRQAHVRPVQLLQPGFEEGEDGAWDEARMPPPSMVRIVTLCPGATGWPTTLPAIALVLQDSQGRRHA